MEEKIETINGKIVYINQKNRNATIEYLKGTKTKEVHTNVSADTQTGWLEAGLIRKSHHYVIGDEVRFQLTLSARGDKQMATAVQYLGNTILSNLLYKAKQKNSFFGYIKQVESAYFIKEADSYILFPLNLSAWERQPDTEKVNTMVEFELTHIDQPTRVQAKLKKQIFTKAYREAEKCFREKKSTPAMVEKVTPNGVYVTLFQGYMKGKLKTDQVNEINPQVGDQIDVFVQFLSPSKLVLATTS
jgi:ribosomal protein S1